jgi:hypothetical protein
MFNGNEEERHDCQVDQSQPKLPKYVGPFWSLERDHPPSSQTATRVAFIITDDETIGGRVLALAGSACADKPNKIMAEKITL